MRSEDRRDLATVVAGAGGVAGGGVLRHQAVQGLKARTGKEPKVHLLGVLRNGTKAQRRMFTGGSALGLAAAPAVAVGTAGLLTGNREVRKADERRGFVREGLSGSVDALRMRGEAALAPVPRDVRAKQLGIAAGAGFSGSAITRAALHGRAAFAKPAVAPIVGVLAATGSVPLSNRAVAGRGYTVTPSGVKRAKIAAKKPSSQASVARPVLRSFREDLAKAEGYLGSRTGYGTQRAVVTAAGHPPVIGPLTSAAAAGRYAPPGQERKHALRQWGLGSGLGFAAGTAGAYAGANAAAKSPTFARRAERGLAAVDGAENRVRGAVGMKGKVRPAGPSTSRLASSRFGKPLLSTGPRRVGAAAGFLGVKALTGAIGGQTAISLNQRDQTRYNAKRGISKAAPAPTKREQHRLAERKRTSAALSVLGGSAGLAGLGLLAAGKKSAATTSGIIGGGFGGTNALLTANVQRKEAKAIDPFAKRERLKLSQDKATNLALVSRYGDRGPLPKGLERGEKMRAYEARYVHHGGDKADKYGRRAEAAEGTRNAGLAVATAAGAGLLAAKTKRGARLAGHVAPKIRRAADTTAIAGGTLAGGAELYGEYARGRRASYTNSPAGVAGSALRRMRDYTPD